jgi:hypothetical protein
MTSVFCNKRNGNFLWFQASIALLVYGNVHKTFRSQNRRRKKYAREVELSLVAAGFININF